MGLSVEYVVWMQVGEWIGIVIFVQFCVFQVVVGFDYCVMLQDVVVNYVVWFDVYVVFDYYVVFQYYIDVDQYVVVD